MIQSIGDYFINDDEIISIAQIDHSIQDKDDIIYEVIRFMDGKPLFLEDHLDRFLQTFQFTHQEIKKYKSLLTKSISLLIEKNNQMEGNIRFQFKNNDTTSFCAWLIPHLYPRSEQYNNGVCVKSYYAERQAPQLKARDIKLRYGTDQFIEEEKIYEAILVSADGQITEGSRSNIFFLKNNFIVTPPLSMVLPGITRQRILNLFKENNVRFEERLIYITEVQNFESCFISGTSPKILPVARFDDTQMNVNHSLLKKLIRLYNQEIETYLEQFIWK